MSESVKKHKAENTYENSLFHKATEIIGKAYVDILAKTSGFTRRLKPECKDYLTGKIRCVFAAWHSQIVQMILAHKFMNIATLVSRSKDGEYIARVLKKFGFLPVRGSTTKRALRGVLEMIKYARLDHSLAVTPDGPRGPRNKAQPGIIYLARKTGLPIIPIGSAVSGKIVFRSWDRFELPLPFSKIRIFYGSPMFVTPGDDIEAKAAELESEMNLLTAAAREAK